MNDVSVITYIPASGDSKGKVHIAMVKKEESGKIISALPKDGSVIPQDILKLFTVIGKNSKCWCRSGKTYKNCHGIESLKKYSDKQLLKQKNRNEVE